MEVAVLVVHELNPSVNGEPVGVDVEQAHEDAYHEALVVEVFCFFHFLYDNNLSVGRSHDNLVGLAFKESFGASEEVEYYGVYNTEDHNVAPEHELAVYGEP